MEKNNLFFEKLTPVNDSDISVYEAAIDFVFKNDDVRNIAISGAYGAGKSSVLASYKAKHSSTKFLHISLAHFQDTQDEGNSNEPIKNSVLEGKILNQLIHQIPANKIPQTNFRIKKSTGNKIILVYYNRLNTTELDYNKMFALVTYKNLFPRDFSDLQLNKGFVYALLCIYTCA